MGEEDATDGLKTTEIKKETSFEAGGKVMEALEAFDKKGDRTDLTDVQAFFAASKRHAELKCEELESDKSDPEVLRYYVESKNQLSAAMSEIENHENPKNSISVLIDELNMCEGTNRYCRKKIEELTESTDRETNQEKVSYYRSRIEESQKRILGLHTGIQVLRESTTTPAEISPKNSQYESFLSLDKFEQEQLIKKTAEKHKVRYSNLSGGYYMFGWQTPVFEEPQERKLLTRIVRDHSLVLSEEEESLLYTSEKNHFKVHVSVPPERRLEVCEAIMQTCEEDDQIINEVFKQKDKLKAAGEVVTPGASNDEIRAAGAKAATLIDWKMKYFGANSTDPRMADFVFYVHRTEDQTMEEALTEMISELKPILEPLHIPPLTEGNMPRYSTKAKSGEVEIPGVSFVEGNGDFKDYLMRTGGSEKLAKYYDPSTNFALRKDTHIQPS